MTRIGVIGAGIIGISSAFAIQEACSTARVTVISEKFTPHTTSDLSGGFVEPHLCGDDPNKIKSFRHFFAFDDFYSLYRKWTNLTIQRIKEYIEEGNEGAGEISGYTLKKERDVPDWLSIMKNVRILDDAELRDVARRPEHKFGIFYTSWYLEPSKYIPYCTERFLRNGGQLRHQKINTIREISHEFDVLVNCTGLGSRFLFGDTSLRPIRGQIIRVACPSIKHFFIDDLYYTLLNDNSIILGGTADSDKWETEIDESVAKLIYMENCKNVPNLKTATIMTNHVGLRPVRPTVRLETQILNFDDGSSIPVVHNYGHGGSGITLHWGCAIETAEHVKKLINKSHI